MRKCDHKWKTLIHPFYKTELNVCIKCGYVQNHGFYLSRKQLKKVKGE
mgnify:CR=1 FL=1